MTLPDYSHIKQQVEEIAEYSHGDSETHRILLHELKELFKDDINSPRRYEQIKSIGDLINILELRDTLSDENVNALKLIARKLNNTELMKQIINYEHSHRSRGLCNYYGTSNNLGTSAQNNHMYNQHTRSNNPFNEISTNKSDRIMRTIIDEIGTFWRDLGRNLKIQEGVIEDIDVEFPNLIGKATKLLEVYDLKKKDPDRWFFQLCEALEKSRRKDLSKSIKEIMMMNL